MQLRDSSLAFRSDVVLAPAHPLDDVEVAPMQRFEARAIAAELERFDAFRRPLPPNATILDVGAHVGLFSLAIAGRRPDVRGFGFEPCRSTFEFLRRNFAARPRGRFEAIPCAVGESTGTAEMTCVPMALALSTLHPGIWGERGEILAALIRGKKRADAGGEIWRFLPDCLTGPIARCLLALAWTETVRVVALSDFISQRRIERVDLLKIDCEGHEAAVLAGIRDEDWKRIRQVILEVHDVAGNLAAIADRLRARGFASPEVMQPAGFENTNVYMMSAAR